MFFIPGPLVAALTFPGIIVHEAAHRLFCDIAKVPVYKACYLRIGSPAGYVVHGPTQDLKSAFLISAGPLIVNTLLCMLLLFAPIYPIMLLDVTKTEPIFYVLMWLGISVGMHAFPSAEDMNNLSDVLRSNQTSGLLKHVIESFILVMALFRLLSFIWFDAIYAVLVGMILPGLFFLLGGYLPVPGHSG